MLVFDLLLNCPFICPPHNFHSPYKSPLINTSHFQQAHHIPLLYSTIHLDFTSLIHHKHKSPEFLETLSLYMKELLAMSFAANTGKPSSFLERFVSNGKFCTFVTLLAFLFSPYAYLTLLMTPPISTNISEDSISRSKEYIVVVLAMLVKNEECVTCNILNIFLVDDNTMFYGGISYIHILKAWASNRKEIGKDTLTLFIHPLPMVQYRKWDYLESYDVLDGVAPQVGNTIQATFLFSYSWSWLSFSRVIHIWASMTWEPDHYPP